jgi:hypothetical protein
VPKDFDKERAASLTPVEERQCVIGGETFTIRAKVRPEVLAPYLGMIGGLAETMTEDEAINLLDTLMGNLVVPGEAEKWARVREIADPEQALSVADMQAVIQWAIQVATGRPTEPSSPSSDGSATTGTGTASTDASRLQAVTSA